MKFKKLFILSMILIINAFGAQSKQETIIWLNNKLGSSPIVQDYGMTYSKILNIKQDGYFTVTQNNEYNNIPSLNSTSIFSGHFKNLSPSTIKINSVKNYYFIVANCSSGRCINQVSTYSNGVEKFTSDAVVLGIVEDSEIAQRVKKALIHLITISGGKKEAF